MNKVFHATAAGRTELRRPRFQVDRAEYPFADNWLERDGSAMHYVDRGRGVPVLMLHGNPTWSFLYRNVIKELEGSCRCIAPDYPGFGLSDHPAGYGFTPREHAVWVAALVDHLKLASLILVVHDWGGPIGLSIAASRPEVIAGLVISNTWAWPPDRRSRIFSIIMGGPIGRYLHLRRNFFARRMVPLGIARREARTAAVLKAYVDPFPTPDSRIGTLVFPGALRTNDEWLRSIEAGLSQLADKPVEMVWAMKDFAFGRESFITRWMEHFPAAHVDRVADAGHFIQEDRPERLAAAVKRVIDKLKT